MHRWAHRLIVGLSAGTFCGVMVIADTIMAQPVPAQSLSQSSVESADLSVDNTLVQDPEIKVGIVQRFGENKTDKLILAPLAGDQLTVSFKTGSEPQTITTERLEIETAMQPLPTPVLQEWVVLSTHRSFESAEDSAKRWQAAGINAEIAQPGAWQVWAKRADYSSPLLRRLLIENLHASGYPNAFIDSQVVTEVPKVAFIADGFRYARDEFSITSANRRIQLGKDAGQLRDLFAGDMKLQPNSYGNYTLVNQVPIELYLRGVVPHEIGPSAPKASIEAQAVLARTYALRNLRRFAIDDYEICADTQCQVYFGLAQTSPRSDQAIAATAGQVLTYNNELVDALYSSTTGGVTARFTDVWNGEDRPYLTPVIDSLQPKWNLAERPLSNETNFRAFISLQSGFNEEGWEAFRWVREASVEVIGETLRKYLSDRQHPLANFNKLTNLTVVERAPSGRVQRLSVETDIGSFDLIKDEAVKALVPLRSLLFYVEPIMELPKAEASSQTSGKLDALDSSVIEESTPNPVAAELEQAVNNHTDHKQTGRELVSEEQNKQAPILAGFRFVGGGFGHGVGMSQTGSYNLGEKGYSYQQILQFYYPGTELQPINSSITFYNAE
ncbi:Stage II sporulation protein [Synechococcus sp. PCC 7335]|uniref:SpoIID/LytB domain-containing protein n=1 Tax=Synechococcus sp. (strain ATCC 29403 / PCC 7335) TaxID=91464 RepID=UPI00017EB14F|nr:SpoIID/LytB domain-containing protein [Synechococcus sp. PCC 7335]EDX85273.1 Stage II sporulation protein [Synechococcus sp. PCC 7335]